MHFKFSVGGVGEEEAQVQEEPKDVVVDAPLVRVFNLLRESSAPTSTVWINPELTGVLFRLPPTLQRA